MLYTDTIGYQLINFGSQFLDALLSLYFLNKFFSPKRSGGKHRWVYAAVVMTLLTHVGDQLSENNVNLWMFQLFFLPFLYTVLFEQGSLKIKFVISELPYIILIVMDTAGANFTGLINAMHPLSYGEFLGIFALRRVGLKLIILFAVKFFLNYSIYDKYYELRSYWDILGVICAIEFVGLRIFLNFQKDLYTRILYVVISFMCFCIPVLFYYMVYLMGIDLNRRAVEISQKNYLETQEQYMNQLLEMQDSMHKFKHDYKAHMFCIDNLLMEQHYDELHSYLEKIHDIEQTYDSFVRYTKDNRVNVILNQIRAMAEKNHLNFQISVKNAEIKNIALYDLNMLLSNLSRNAMEAAVNTEEKTVELQMEKERAYLKIVMSNSVEENPLEKNPELVTSKKDRKMHGFGMQIIQNVADRYQGVVRIEGSDERMRISLLLMDEDV